MLTVNEIYLSIQGESSHVGRPCVFVRLTACDLRCAWCDTAYAFTEGRKMPVEAVVAALTRYGCKLVEITGGEPLLQADVYPLMEALIQSGYEVLVETGGHVPLTRLPRKVRAIIDVKCPGSGEANKMHWSNLGTLKPTDEVKFVIQDRIDFDYATTVVRDHRLTERAAAVLFSPVHGVMPPDLLAKWILEAHLPVRLQLQAHKYIWPAATRGV